MSTVYSVWIAETSDDSNPHQLFVGKRSEVFAFLQSYQERIDVMPEYFYNIQDTELSKIFTNKSNKECVGILYLDDSIIDCIYITRGFDF